MAEKAILPGSVPVPAGSARTDTVIPAASVSITTPGRCQDTTVTITNHFILSCSVRNSSPRKFYNDFFADNL